MWKLEGAEQGYQCERNTEKRRVYQKRNYLRKTFINIATLTKLEPEYIHKHEDYHCHPADNWHHIESVFLVAYEYLVQARWDEEKGVQTVEVLVVKEPHLKSQITIHRDL